MLYNSQVKYDQHERDLMIAGLLSRKESNLSKINEINKEIEEIEVLLSKLGHEGKKTKKRTHSWRSCILSILGESNRCLSRDQIHSKFCENYPDIINDLGQKKCRNSLSSSYSRLVADNSIFKVKKTNSIIRYGLTEWTKDLKVFDKIIRRLLEEGDNFQSFTFEVNSDEANEYLRRKFRASLYG